MPLKTLKILATSLFLSTQKSTLKNLRAKKQTKNTKVLEKIQDVWSLKTMQKE